MTSSWSRYYSVNVTVDSLFGVVYGNGKGGVGTRTTHLQHHKIYCWLDGGDLCHTRVGIIHPWAIVSNKYTLLHQIGETRINLVLLVMVMVVFVLGSTTYTPKILILAKTGMMDCFGHLRVIKQHYLWCHLGVGIIQLNLPMFLHSSPTVIFLNYSILDSPQRGGGGGVGGWVTMTAGTGVRIDCLSHSLQCPLV